MIQNKATLIKTRKIADNTFELQFVSESNFEYKAGQFITVKIPTKGNQQNIMRSYSISKANPSERTFELCIKKVENGIGSSFLSEITESYVVEYMGPFGHFTFDETSNKNHIFIGTGTGIAPLKAIIEDELNKGNKSKFHLFFGVRYVKDLSYKDFLENLAKKYKNFTYEITISRPENDSWTKEPARVTDLLKKTIIDPLNTDAYICGLKEMVLEATQILIEKGVDKKNIHFERFN